MKCPIQYQRQSYYEQGSGLVLMTPTYTKERSGGNRKMEKKKKEKVSKGTRGFQGLRKTCFLNHQPLV
jgi:hypothetical protein